MSLIIFMKLTYFLITITISVQHIPILLKVRFNNFCCKNVGIKDFIFSKVHDKMHLYFIYIDNK